MQMIQTWIPTPAGMTEEEDDEETVESRYAIVLAGVEKRR
jgi:hypothetical protein